MIIKDISNLFGVLVITRGRNQTLLGMKIETIDGNNIEIVTKHDIQESIERFYEDVSTKVSTEAKKNMHKVNPESPIPPKKKAKYFHPMVANILWTTKQALLYIETEVNFICTQVKSLM